MAFSMAFDRLARQTATGNERSWAAVFLGAEKERGMNSIIYLIGLVVVIGFVLSFLGVI
jgi:hypothetical protein